MPESYYSTLGARARENLTPYSAVSSFNLPVHYDHNLVTPVLTTTFLTVPPKPTLPKEMDIKLSPTSLSPNYDMFHIEDDFQNDRYNPPMKLKDPTAPLRILTSDNFSPQHSPLMPTTPYFGHFGVSGTPVSSRSASSPSMSHSPPGHNLYSTGGLGSDSSHNRLPMPTSLGSNYRPPIRIAPNPPSLRPALQQDNGPWRQNSGGSQPPTSTHSSSAASATSMMTISEPLSALPVRRKRKPSKADTADGEVILSGETTWEEQVLLQLSHVDRLPWKDVASQYKEKTNKTMKVPALQMKKKRLLERLRVWTPTDERALFLANDEQIKMKWEKVAEAMMKHGCVEKWPKELVEKKWHEMQKDGIRRLSEYEATRHRKRRSDEFGLDDFSDGTHSFHGSPHSAAMSAISPHNTLNEFRSRQGSDSSSHFQLQQQHQQQQHMSSSFVLHPHNQHSNSNW